MKMTVGAAAAFALLAASSAAEAADPAVAVVLGVKGSPFYQALACGAKAKAKELGLALTVSAPDQFAADSQIPVVNAIAATTPAVAVIVPTDAKALIAPMKQLADRGTKIVTVDQTIEDSSFVQTQILTDNAQGGRLAADAINALLDGKGEVLVITQPPGSAAQDARTTGFEEELKKYPRHRLSRRAISKRRSPEGGRNRDLDTSRPIRSSRASSRPTIRARSER